GHGVGGVHPKFARLAPVGGMDGAALQFEALQGRTALEQSQPRAGIHLDLTRLRYADRGFGSGVSLQHLANTQVLCSLADGGSRDPWCPRYLGHIPSRGPDWGRFRPEQNETYDNDREDRGIRKP